MTICIILLEAFLILNHLWNTAIGIFHNDAQTALAWVNEEDHCRIISMELGGDIPSVFTRFCELSNAIKVSGQNISYAHCNFRVGCLVLFCLYILKI